jgi:hypothetical protein
MGFYQDQVVPLLTSLSMRNKNLAAYRKRVVPEATGRVLEIGIGSGARERSASDWPRSIVQAFGNGRTRLTARSVGRFRRGVGRKNPAGESERRYGRNDLDFMHHS